MVDPTIADLVARALPGRRVGSVERIGGDRGVFSLVHRVTLEPASVEPRSVVVKQPDPGPNGSAAAASGAYEREALAYRSILPVTPVAAPRCHLVDSQGDGRASFVLEDLTRWRAVDQLDGLSTGDAAALVDELGVLHRRWANGAADDLPVRRATPAAFDPAALARGLAVVSERWQESAGAAPPLVLGRLLSRRAELVDAFASAGPVTLCHGDPRADNVVFSSTGRAVLFDWQQLGVNLPQADLAWLTTTSLEPETRRRCEDDLIVGHAAGLGQDPEEARLRYRLGMILPGLAVLLLAQRQLTSERAERFVATSLRRIATAVDDLEIAALAS
jgi:aminoglycoside phosphotransferase (APT) family kinase protein